MTWYREINAVQSHPQDLGEDADGRVQFVFTVDVVCRHSEEVAKEVAQLLVDTGTFTWGTDLFHSTEADIPDGDGPYTLLVDRSAAPPERTHNVKDGPAYIRPAVLVNTRAATTAAALARAWAAFNALDGVRNTEVSSAL